MGPARAARGCTVPDPLPNFTRSKTLAYTSLRDAPFEIVALRTFTGNSFRGEHLPDGLPSSWGDVGWLNQDGPTEGTVYIVWSYATPIGWVDGTGRKVIVDQRFSSTTSKHQSRLRSGFAGLQQATIDRVLAAVPPRFIIREEDDIRDLVAA